MLNIVLLEPEIPQNTGNIVRTCAATGSRLHLIKPLGFDISEKAVRRAGLDYWHYVDISVYENLQDFYEKNPDGNFYYTSTKGSVCYTEPHYQEGDFIFFGKETTGLPEDLIAANEDKALRIPMLNGLRCLNLSNAVAIMVYEGLRQQGFKDFDFSPKAFKHLDIDNQKDTDNK